ncbi:DUF397 domain-containing protein [Streptomyces maoxianensis]|uniref:DUF397 domain-containing protein n=1 Tax=Streptomyces maoxianensis TaxID=1459942 RepID=A0ABV9G959_9ACTN
MNTTELDWFKSSYSDAEGGACVEVAYDWRKSSYSDGEGGDCVEVATCPTTIRIRDSKNTARPHLAVTPVTWSAFVSYARRHPTG